MDRILLGGVSIGIILTLFEQRKRFWKKAKAQIIAAKLVPSPIGPGSGNPVADAQAGVYDEMYDVQLRCRYEIEGAEVTGGAFRPLDGRRRTRTEAEILIDTGLAPGGVIEIYTNPRSPKKCKCGRHQLGYGPLVIATTCVFLATAFFMQ